MGYQRQRPGWFVLCVAGVLLALCSTAQAQDTSLKTKERVNYGRAHGGLSFLSEMSSLEAVAGTFGWGLSVGRRWGAWGAFIQMEHNIWVLTEVGGGPFDSVVNFGLGGEVLYYKQYVRSSMALGTSTALFDTILDDFGETGFFLDIRPMGYRVPLDNLIIELDPLSFIVMVPIIEGIPLVQLSYRSVVSVEVAF